MTERKGNSRNIAENSKSSKKNVGSSASKTSNENAGPFEPKKTENEGNKMTEENVQDHLELTLTPSNETAVIKEPPRKHQEDIASLIEIDSNFINFGSFYPGKIFKCNLSVKNITNHKRTISLSFDSASPEFTKSNLLRTLFLGTLPANLTYPIPNSENSAHCWHFMMPPSKSFEKTLTLSLQPHSSIQIGVVIKSPCISRPEKFYSLVKVQLSSDDPMSSLLTEDRDSLMSLCGADVITPKLECCKELIHEQAKVKVIPLVVKFEGAVQRLRIPFKNAGAKDLELILSIVKFPTGPGKIESEPLAEYHCVPGTVKMPANSMGFVTIGINRGADKRALMKEEREQRVLIAKVKDTLMMYSYVLDCCFIP